MERSKPILLALLLAALPAWAQNSTAPGEQAAAKSTEQAAGAVDTSQIILSRNPDEATANPDAGLEPADTPLSPTLAGELAADGPRFKPVKVVPESAADRDPASSRAETHGLPVSEMSKFTVHGSRVNGFSDHDLYTTEGLIDVSMDQHPGERLGNILNLNGGAAYEAYFEADRLSKMQDLYDTAEAIAVGGDATEARAIQAAAADAFMRTDSPQGPVGIK